MTPLPLRKTTFRLRPVTHEHLRRLAFDNRMSMSALVDELLFHMSEDAVRRYLKIIVVKVPGEPASDSSKQSDTA